MEWIWKMGKQLVQTTILNVLGTRFCYRSSLLLFAFLSQEEQSCSEFVSSWCITIRVISFTKWTFPWLYYRISGQLNMNKLNRFSSIIERLFKYIDLMESIVTEKSINGRYGQFDRLKVVVKEEAKHFQPWRKIPCSSINNRAKAGFYLIWWPKVASLIILTEASLSSVPAGEEGVMMTMSKLGVEFCYL